MLLKRIKLQQIKTNEGMLFPIYKDWEEWHGGYEPKMVYVTTLNPGVIKGPILHKKRRGLITAISGTVILVARIGTEFESIFLHGQWDETGDLQRASWVVEIPANVPFVLHNKANWPAIIINCPDRAWHPDDEDTIKFDSWEDVP